MNYFDHTGVSQSMLKILDENPNKFFRMFVEKSMHSDFSTPALEEGKMFDLLLTEPKEFYKKYTIKEGVKTTKEEGFIAEPMYNKILAMVKKTENKIWDAESNLTVKEVLQTGCFQEEIFWVDFKSFVECKAKLDWVSDDHKVIIDFKTTTGSNPQEFYYSIKKYQYHLQAAMYCKALQAKYKLNFLPDFYLIAIEKTMPYPVYIYKLGDNAMQKGIEKMDELLEKYIKLLSSDDWRHDKKGIEIIDF